MIQLPLTLKMTTAEVVETSVTVNNNRPIQDYIHPDDQTQPTFKNLTCKSYKLKILKCQIDYKTKREANLLILNFYDYNHYL